MESLQTEQPAGQVRSSSSHSPSSSINSVGSASSQSSTASSDRPRTGPMDDPRPKLKGRMKFIQSLQRMSSSPSLARRGRSPSGAYRSGGLGSMSCVSLSSTMSPDSLAFPSPLRSELSPGYSTAPTSSTPTPGSGPALYDVLGRKVVVTPGGRTTVPLPAEVRPSSRLGTTPAIVATPDEYFPETAAPQLKRRKSFDFWHDLPSEIKVQILQWLEPREIVRCSAVSHSWHKACFDGQLWARLDTSGFYRDIPADALVKIITEAGPFVRDLNLRGCVQLREKWNERSLQDACRNLENFSLEGCRIDRGTIHTFLLQNPRLVHVNLSGLPGATNHGMKILAQACPKLEHLNVTWCTNVDTRGIRHVIRGCPSLRDLRAGEVRGWDNLETMAELHTSNTLERLILMHCDSLTDESLGVLIHGRDPEVDYITGRPIVTPRRLKHLDLTRCRNLTDAGLKKLAHNVPALEGLKLSKCAALTDDSLTDIIPTLPVLTHLDLEELDELTNATLQCLAQSPCRQHLKHLTISYCESLGDAGMLPVLKECHSLASIDMDNTRISDLSLAEAAFAVRARPRILARSTPEIMGKGGQPKPVVGLHLAVYDCQNVTWTGVREILSRNAEVRTKTLPMRWSQQLSRKSADIAHSATHRDSIASASGAASAVDSSPRNLSPMVKRKQIIALKSYYGWQPTIAAHFTRCQRGDFGSANRLERKWAEFMQATEEMDAGGRGMRRRRRRVREAAMMHADEAENSGAEARGGGVAGLAGLGLGRRRRARSGGCAIM